MEHDSVTSRSPLGELIAAERRRRSLARGELAELVRKADRTLRTHEKTIRRWEAGGEPQPAALRALAKALGRPVEELMALLQQGTASGRIAGLNLPDLPPAAPADHEYVEAIRATVQHLVSLDNRYGGDEVAPLAVRSLRVAQRRRHSGAYDRSIERDLLAATGELAELAGWLLFDADQQDAARQMNHEALHLARLAGDRSMELLILGNMSFQDIFMGRPGSTLQITRAVLDGRYSALTSRLQVVFGVREARALAQLQDRTAALRVLERAHSRFEDGVSARDPAWGWWIDEGEVVHQTGLCRAELGDHPAAVALLQRAAEECSPHLARSRFIFRVRLLQAMSEAGAWDDALTTIDDVLPYVGEVGSRRTADLLRRTVTSIEHDHAPAQLRDAARHLGDVLAAS